MTLAIIITVGLLLAFGNGANDNFKGVATLYGSDTTSYRSALIWATVTTGLGSVAAIFLASELLSAFSGKGLVPTEVAGQPAFAAAVALGAASTVLLATRLGFPISTTHSLIGALVGAGLLSAAGEIDTATLGRGFMLPLLVSPFLAILATLLIYPFFRWWRERAGVSHETCICIGERVVHTLPGQLAPAEAMQMATAYRLDIDDSATCRLRYRGRFVGLRAARLLNLLHFLSAGMVSFARGLNDTPKIAALLLVGSLVAPDSALMLVGAAIALGGWLGARRIAETMSHKITDLRPGQGFTANLVTAGLVIGASNLGLPVSTTHVSCGALFGIGAVTRQAHWKTIGEILLAWVTTLPMAALLAGGYSLLLAKHI